jgi:hypothetical protein
MSALQSLSGGKQTFSRTRETPSLDQDQCSVLCGKHRISAVVVQLSVALKADRQSRGDTSFATFAQGIPLYGRQWPLGRLEAVANQHPLRAIRADGNEDPAWQVSGRKPVRSLAQYGYTAGWPQRGNRFATASPGAGESRRWASSPDLPRLGSHARDTSHIGCSPRRSQPLLFARRCFSNKQPRGGRDLA